MTTETRIGLLVGLMFIIAFGLVLGELSDPAEISADDLRTDKALGQMARREVAGELPDRQQFRMKKAARVPSLAAVDPPHEVVEVALHDTSSSGGVYESRMVRDEVPAAVVGKPYVVEEGDTLIRIARKVYGRGKDMQYKRIFEANRDILKNESDVYVGQKLIIPALLAPADEPAIVRRPAAPERYQEMTIAQAGQTFGRSRQRQEIRIYIVRQNDNLTRIARAELNDGSDAAVRRLFEANRDVLDNPNDIQVGMKLRIPS